LTNHLAYYSAPVPLIVVDKPPSLNSIFIDPPTLFMSTPPEPPFSSAPKDLHSGVSSIKLLY